MGFVADEEVYRRCRGLAKQLSVDSEGLIRDDKNIMHRALAQV